MMLERKVNILLRCLFLCCLHLQGVSAVDTTISQWAASVTSVSTQYPTHLSTAIIGPADVYPTYADSALSWAPRLTQTTNEFIEFVVNTAVCVTSVSTYEAFNGGFVVKILALNPSRAWDVLWSGNATNIQSSRIFSPTLANVLYATKTFRIVADGTPAGASYFGLDAVRINGTASCGGVVTLDTVSQWATSVMSVSTQYPGHYAAAIIGQPDYYPTNGDSANSWMPRFWQTSNEFIEFQISTAVCVTSVATYETFNAGFVVKILALNPSRAWDELWSGNASWVQYTSRIFSPTLRNVSYATRTFRIYMDGTPAVASWIQLDAVRVDGLQSCGGVVTADTISQWAASVTSVSTQYSNHLATAILGQPDIYPTYVDSPYAWAPAAVQTSNEFIEFQITTAVCVTAVATYETLCTGFIVKIAALNPSRAWDELWSGNASYGISGRIFSPTLRSVSYATRTFRIYMDGTAAPSLIELDAVRVDGIQNCGGLVVVDALSQWVANVTGYSHQYTVCNFAVQIIGQPDIYPLYGAYNQAWAPLNQQTSSEFIEFVVTTSVCVTSVATYETQNSGFVMKIQAQMPDGTWDDLWSGNASWVQSSRIFSPTLRNVSYTTRTFRVYGDGRPAGARYYHLDAVRVDGMQSCTSCVSALGTGAALSPFQNLCSANNQHKVILDGNGGIYIDGQQWLSSDLYASSSALNYTTKNQLIVVVNGTVVKWQLDLPNNAANGLPGNVTVTNDGLLQIVNAAGVPLWNHKQGYLLPRLVIAYGLNYLTAPLIEDRDNNTCTPDTGIIIMRIAPTPRNTSRLASVVGRNLACGGTSQLRMVIPGMNDSANNAGKICTVVSASGTTGCTFLCTCSIDICDTVTIVTFGCAMNAPVCEVLFP